MGGTHEQGIRAALSRGVKIYGEMTGHKKIVQVMPDDILESACMMLSVFIKDPVFQGQTKEKLVSNGITKQIENLIKDHFDHWLSGNKKSSDQLIQHFINNAEYRLSRKNERLVSRKTAVQKLRLPGKLADCSSTSAAGTELFLVEGDSAGGSAKQARDRQTQAILPLRGKILNVANATAQKIAANQEIQDLEVALNCGSLNNYNEDALRYEKIIIMTDADVDGAHIAALLMTFFYMRMRKLIENGHLYLAKPPLYRLVQGTKTYYAADEEQKVKLFKKLSKDRKSVEIGRFKGLGEMTPKQLKETTMEKKTRLLYKVGIADFQKVDMIVDNLMGKKPEKRFQFIQEQALERGDEEIALYV
jgi:topoisomerase-4 subunit B